MAGGIVTIMLIPQSLAQAMLAGLPPEEELYASILPIIVAVSSCSAAGALANAVASRQRCNSWRCIVRIAPRQVSKSGS